jgi:hypothetical protein
MEKKEKDTYMYNLIVDIAYTFEFKKKWFFCQREMVFFFTEKWFNEKK